MQYSRLHSKRCRYFQITTNTSSIGCLFFRLFSSSHAHFSPRDLLISFQSGLSGLLLSSCTHIAGFSARQFLSTPSFPRNLATSFQGVFSGLLFFPKTHDMCFFSYLSSQKHTFLPGTHQLASGLCFSACFSS